VPKPWVRYGAYLTIVACVSCNGGQASSFIAPANVPASARGSFGATPQAMAALGPIKHVIIIVQENRTPDYLFQGVPGADIAKTATDWHGKTVPLRPTSLAGGHDLGHQHDNFSRDYDHGKLDGFDKGLPLKIRLRPFGYAPRSQVEPYFVMATQYVFADHMFQSNQGPSFPAHLYIITGTADASEKFEAADNPRDRTTHRVVPGGCDAPKDARVATIDPIDGVNGASVYPCFDHRALSDLLDAKGVSWRYYQSRPFSGLWEPFDALRHVRYGSDYANVVSPSTRVLNDIARNRLADVSWITPGGPFSDHAGPKSTARGPSWVAAIVNAVGYSGYWNDTAIFITWDDWGGWYDHVKPPMDNYYELGFRVPLVIISPYAKYGYVSKVQHEFGSILAFTEETFGIPKGSLNSTDVRADDLSDAFDFNQQPGPFWSIPAPPFRSSPGDLLGDEDP